MTEKKKQFGFTVLELIIAVVLLAALGTVFLIQRRDLEVMNRDNNRKVAINSMYYSLEDVFRASHNGYPETITSETLKGVDPSLLKDPDGVMIGEQNSDYRYTPEECNDGICKRYELRADLENEADFVKNNR